MEEFDPAEKIIDFTFFIWRKIYRHFEVKFIVWYERKFDGVQRQQLRVSKYLFKFMIILCTLFYGFSYLVWDYNARTQTVLNPVVKAKEFKSLPTPKVEMNIIEILDYVHMKESSRGMAESGHHVYCKSIGKSNEYGYSPKTNYCFDSYEESVIYLKDYIQGLIDEFGTYEGLCVYNTGFTKQGNCEYVEILKSWKK